MIVLSTPEADIDGVIELVVDYSRSNLDPASRRVSRHATLDGGVAIPDGGYSDGDRTLRIVAIDVDEAQDAAIRNMHRNNTVIHLAMFDGFYRAVIKQPSFRNGEAILTVYIELKLS